MVRPVRHQPKPETLKSQMTNDFENTSCEIRLGRGIEGYGGSRVAFALGRLAGFHRTESVYEVVLQKSIPAQIRHLTLHYYHKAYTESVR